MFFSRHEILCSNQAMLKCAKPVGIVNDQIVFIHSNIHSIDGVHENVVIEFTELKEGCSVGAGSIISNNIFPAGICVPQNSFLHTVVINDAGKQFYVTVAFGTEDNLKKTCQNREGVSSLIYAGLSFEKALEKLHLPTVSLPKLFIHLFIHST